MDPIKTKPLIPADTPYPATIGAAPSELRAKGLNSTSDAVRYVQQSLDLIHRALRRGAEVLGLEWLLRGSGDPEGTVRASIGAVYSRKDGGAATTLYVKETGTGNTGWVAVAPGGPGGGTPSNTVADLDGTASAGTSTEYSRGDHKHGGTLAGPPGDAATVAVGSTTTGAPGTDAEVTNSGTTSAAVLDFVIPRGEKGDAGVAGQDGAPGVPGYTPNQLISGGYVAWIDDHRYRVSAAVYIIGGVQYSSAETEVTLTTPDSTYDRIDLIAVDDTGTVVVVDGTPSSAPARPDVDPAAQLGLTFAIVPANSTVPPDVSSTDIYHENTEWTSSVSANFNAASTNNPHAGTKCVEATAATTGNYVQLAAASPVDLSTRNNLIFYIRSKAVWASKRQVQIYFANAGVRSGSAVVLNEGAFGFSTANTTAYQQIVIPLSLFAVSGTVQQLRFQVAGSQGTIGFYLDDITLQGGVTPPVVTVEPSNTVAALDGTGAAGSSAAYSRGDHKHGDTARHTHSNKSTLDSITAAYTSAEATKLAGIEAGAQVNPSYASQAEAEAGTENTKIMTALRVKQAIAALAHSGIRGLFVDARGRAIYTASTRSFIRI